MTRIFFLAAALLLLGRDAAPAGHDWPIFGWDAQHSSSPTVSMGLTPGKLGSLQRHQVKLDGTVDASAIYLSGVEVKGATRNVLVVTTTYGKTQAIDAAGDSVLWTYTPEGYGSWAGSYRITNSTPVADPDRRHVYAAAPDGAVRKLALSDGHEIWSTPVTRLPAREKLTSPLGYWRGRVIAVIGGYIGDRPPYQGHVALLDAESGRLAHVWNSLCSDRPGLLDPSRCPANRSAIWGRSGAAVDTTNGHIFVATGNGPWDGQTSWGDAVLELDSAATQLLGNFTPENTDQLEATDADLGSTSPVLLGDGLIVQGGKAGKLHLLDWSQMRGTDPHKDHELQVVTTPSGNDLFSVPAVWHRNGTAWLFVADRGGTAAWTLAGRRLQEAWHNDNGGTSPVVADGMLFVYDPGGQLRVYDAPSGKLLKNFECGSGHWNSPIVVDGMIVLTEGSANRHETSGVMDIWR
jgi:hypothetical protein